jgi:hypothetical protein
LKFVNMKAFGAPKDERVRAPLGITLSLSVGPKSY